MLALLKLVPLKDWIYTGLIVALIAGFALFVHHERVIGEDTIKVADAKVVAARIAHNTKVEANAQATVTQIAQTYADVSSAPPAADAPHLWVQHSAPSSCTPSANAGTPGRTDGGSVLSAEVSNAGEEPDPSAFDVGPQLDKSFEDADAQVTGLQDYIKACQTEGLCKR